MVKISLRDTDALVIEVDSLDSAPSLVDPTTVNGRTYDLTNTRTTSVVWTSIGATPFMIGVTAAATLTVARGGTVRVQSDGVHWVVIDPTSTVPACPTNPMTRAALMALRTAGTLSTQCHYVVSDSPVIGTTGNTSATTVELHAVSATELSLSGSVHTTFDNSAWFCLYDIDLGAAGTFLEIKDNQGNTVKSTVADAPTVQTQFPWHLTVSGQVRNNLIEESTLTGWGAVTTTIRGNQITRNSTVALTGNWGIFTDNRIEASTVSLLHSAGGTRTFTGNTVRGAATFRTLAGATGSHTITDNDFLDGYIAETVATSTATVTLDGCRFDNHGSSASDLQVDGSGTRSLNNIYATSTGTTQFVLTGAGGTVTLSQCEFYAGKFVRDPATTASATVQIGTRINGTIVQGPGATVGALTISGCVLPAIGTTINHLGPGALTLNSVTATAGVTIAATATRGLSVVSSQLIQGNLNQNRTGGTGLDTVTGTTLEGTVNLNGAVDPGMNQTVLNSVRIAGIANVTLTDPAAVSIILQRTDIYASTVTGTGTGLVTGCRFACECSVNLGAFAHNATIIEGAFTKVLTASNAGRLCNKSFDDTI